MKAFKHNNLNNFIAGWYIDTNLCDLIIKVSENNLESFSSGVKEYTNCDLFTLSEPLHRRYSENLYKAVEEYKKLYPQCYEHLHAWGWTPPRIQRYEPGKSYNELHCENTGLHMYQNRHLAYMTYLNDINEGGGTEFVQHNLTTKAETGLTLIWPAGWTHFHRGVVAPSDTKYIITGWFCFQPDNETENY